MPTRLTRSARFLTLLLAAMQFAVPAVVSVVDGAVAESARVTGTHVEEFGRNKCTPPHSADCAICRFLSTTQSHGSTAVAAVIVSRVSAAPETLVALSATTARHGFDSRAPPTFLD